MILPNFFLCHFYRPEDAAPDFESVLKLNKDFACAHVNLGLIMMSHYNNYHRYGSISNNLYTKQRKGIYLSSMFEIIVALGLCIKPNEDVK